MEEKRERIREIDKQICDLLSERAEVAKELADVKQREGESMTDAAQEMVVIDRAEEWLSEFANVDFHVARIFREIIDFTKTQMR